jgi:hypothetical protein
MDEAARRAAYGLRKAIDSLRRVAVHRHRRRPTRSGRTHRRSPAQRRWHEGVRPLVDLGRHARQHRHPEDGRFCVVPPWFEGYLLKDDRAISFGTQGNRRPAAERLAGRRQRPHRPRRRLRRLPLQPGPEHRRREVEGHRRAPLGLVAGAAAARDRGVPPRAPVRRRAEGPARLRRQGHPSLQPRTRRASSSVSPRRAARPSSPRSRRASTRPPSGRASGTSRSPSPPPPAT